MKPLYFLDIGNTRGKFWRLDDGVVTARFSASHESDMGALLAALPPSFVDVPAALYGSCVLDSASTGLLSRACEGMWGLRPMFARSRSNQAGITSAYKEPGLLGVDRWLGMLALGVLSPKVCLVSCGTAITIDLLDRGQHFGGYIIPGIRLQAAALRMGTQMLRPVEVDASSLSPGAGTDDAIMRGSLLAAVGLVERVVVQEGVGLTVLTGGDAFQLARHLTAQHIVDPELMLVGLNKYFLTEAGNGLPD